MALTINGDGIITGLSSASGGYDDKIQSNIAMLGFKTATNGSLAKYSLVDQIIDEYIDGTGIDAGNSTNQLLTGGAYTGGSTINPSQDADSVTTDGDYTVYKWTDTGSTGSFTPNVNGSFEYLVVAGGGAGGRESYSFGTGGGGGAGGYLANNAYNLSLTASTAYTITVGAGGAAVTTSGGYTGNNGSNSSITGSGLTAITAIGGGGGGGGTGSGSNTAGNGGSGGGAGGHTSPTQGSGNGATRGTGTSGPPVQGYIGAWGDKISDGNYGGGGGGAAEAGGTDNSTVGTDTILGGDGIQNDITGSNVFYAGGGGGAHDNTYSSSVIALGGSGGGGTGAHYDGSGGGTAGTAGTANTGGGGGGGGNHDSNQGGAGGSGVVILRTKSFTPGLDLTLQSTATTATAAPTKADLVVLIENVEGDATINTDIKGYISRDGSAFSSAVTFVDEGSWGDDKKVFAAHDVDISGITSGTSMKYKITTHNQSAGSKETKIHATSLGWK